MFTNIFNQSIMKKFIFLFTVVCFVACKRHNQVILQDEYEKRGNIVCTGNTQFSISMGGEKDIWNSSGTGLFNDNSGNYNFDLGRSSSGSGGYTPPTINWDRTQIEAEQNLKLLRINEVNSWKNHPEIVKIERENKELNKYLKSSYKDYTEGKWVKIPSSFLMQGTTTKSVVKPDPTQYYNQLNEIDRSIQHEQVHYLRNVAGGVKHTIPNKIGFQLDDDPISSSSDIFGDGLMAYHDLMVYEKNVEELYKKKDIVYKKMKEDGLENEVNRYILQDKYARGKSIVKGKARDSSMSEIIYQPPHYKG